MYKGWLSDYAIKRGVRVVVVRKFNNTLCLIGPALFFVIISFSKSITLPLAAVYISCAM